MAKDALRLAAVLAALSTSGCAYLTTYSKSLDLTESSYALDVKQRVVFSKSVTTREGPKRVICAEPSPDALTVISASAGAGAAAAIQASERRAAENAGRSTDTDRSSESNRSSDNTRSASGNGSVNVAAALAEQGAFIGLRTQSIQLLRDTMYRLCEGYAAGAVPEEEFTAMQRRYQSTMLGLLAIEQLTRPVVAAQVVLASSATSASGLSPNEAAFDRAQSRVDQKTSDDTQARLDLNAAISDQTAARRALEANASEGAAARAKAEGETSGDPAAKKAAGEAAAKTFLEARPALVTRLAEADKRTLEATAKADVAARALRQAEADLVLARNRVVASASGSGQFGVVREASAQMTKDLADKVADIVGQINKSYLIDGCFALMAKDQSQAAAAAAPATAEQQILRTQRERQLSAAMSTCTRILSEVGTGQALSEGGVNSQK